VLLRLSGRNREAAALHRNFQVWSNLNAEPYNRSLLCSSTNTQELQRRLSPAEAEIFPVMFTPEIMGWEKFTGIFCGGIRRLLLQQSGAVKKVQQVFTFIPDLPVDAPGLPTFNSPVKPLNPPPAAAAATATPMSSPQVAAAAAQLRKPSPFAASAFAAATAAAAAAAAGDGDSFPDLPALQFTQSAALPRLPVLAAAKSLPAPAPRLMSVQSLPVPAVPAAPAELAAVVGRLVRKSSTSGGALVGRKSSMGEAASRAGSARPSFAGESGVDGVQGSALGIKLAPQRSRTLVRVDAVHRGKSFSFYANQ
jgi:hypothetical protein